MRAESLGRSGPAQLGPARPKGVWGRGHPLVSRRKVVFRPSPTSYFLPLSPAVELEPGRDRRDSGKAPAPLPRGAQRGWLSLGPEHKLSGPSRDTRPASPASRWEEERRPRTGTWCAAVISVLEALVYFRELGRRENRSVPFLHLSAGSKEQILGWGSQWDYPKQDRCVEPRHSGEEMALRSVELAVTRWPTPGESQLVLTEKDVIRAFTPFLVPGATELGPTGETGKGGDI